MSLSNQLSKALKVIFYLSLCYFTYLMMLITIQYIPIHFDVAFLRIKQDVIVHRHYQISFFTHVYTSIFVLIIGSFQFVSALRKRFRALHRFLGQAYVALILFFAAPSGLILGYYANGGIIAQIGFMLLALFWFYTTFAAFNFARKKQFEKHRKYMIRSYAFTLSAITLRLLKLGIVNFWELPPMDITRIIAWGAWISNLVFAELIIRFWPMEKLKLTIQ
jgi:uncharacterized membrane protein